MKGLTEEKKIVKRPSSGKKKNLERLSRGKNIFIFEFSSGPPPQIINGRPLSSIEVYRESLSAHNFLKMETVHDSKIALSNTTYVQHSLTKIYQVKGKTLT